MGCLGFSYGCLGSEFVDRSLTKTENSDNSLENNDGLDGMGNTGNDPGSVGSSEDPTTTTSGEQSGPGQGAQSATGSSGGSSSSSGSTCSQKMASNSLYVSQSLGYNGRLFKVNSSTGKIVPPGFSFYRSNLHSYVSAGVGFEAMSYHKGELYAAYQTWFYKIIKPCSGTYKVIGKSNTKTFWDAGGLASHKGKLYLVAAENNLSYLNQGYKTALFTVDTKTGKTTKVGTAITGKFTNPTGLASFNGRLYMTAFTRLHTVDELTGKATRVGDSSQFGLNRNVLTGGLTVHNGKLYMIINALYGANKTDGTDGLYEVDTSDGTAMKVDTDIKNWGWTSQKDKDKRYRAIVSTPP